MIHKVSELEGALLDAAVAKAEGHTFRVGRERGDRSDTCWVDIESSHVRELYPPSSAFAPSTEWAHGGPIIERERIDVFTFCNGGSLSWHAGYGYSYQDDGLFFGPSALGPTPLIAVMRAYVASKFGEEVDLP